MANKKTKRRKEMRNGKTKLQALLTDGKKSVLRKYSEVVIGLPGIFPLIKYELLTSIFGPMPGALGLVLRKVFFRFLVKKTGNNVVFGRSLTIRHPHKITIGSNVVIDDYVVLDAKGSNNIGIKICDNVIIGRNTVVSCKNGDIYIGDGSNIAMHCFIQSAKSVKIGMNVLLAAYSYIIGGGKHKSDRIDIPIIAQGQEVENITIEDNCWIGAGVKVLDGLTIGRDAIIGSGAVVTKDIPEFSIAVGMPAVVIKKREGN